MVAIESIGYVDFGDKDATFIKWLKGYARLEPIEITFEEL